MREDVVIKSSKFCSQCGKKMHHGQTAVSILNSRGKIKAYCCSDACSDLYQELIPF